MKLITAIAVSVILSLASTALADSIDTNANPTVIYQSGGQTVKLTMRRETGMVSLSVKSTGTSLARDINAEGLVQAEVERIVLAHAPVPLGTSGASILFVEGFPLYNLVTVKDPGGVENKNKKVSPSSETTLTFGVSSMFTVTGDGKLMIITKGTATKPQYYPYSLLVTTKAERK